MAKDIGWFTEYTPFETELGSAYGPLPEPIRVVGVGTVEIPTETSPNSVGPESSRILRLTTVLHAPSILCNILGGPIMNDHGTETHPRGDTKGFITDREGRPVAYFDPSRPLYQLKLHNPPAGYYALTNDGHYTINAGWSPSERDKWHAHQKNRATSLSDEEKAWLKQHYGNEFHFLRAYWLSIYKEKDREEGRSILRALMQCDQE